MDELYLTAYHEAGHAVAAVMRSAGELRSITIEATSEYLGHTGFRGKPCDASFVTYAGPWGEARAQWPYPTLSQDDEDDDGTTFDEYLLGAWLRNSKGDGAHYERTREADAALLGSYAHLVDTREATWSRELEREWPVIQQVASRLMAGETLTDQEVRAAMTAVGT